MTARKISINRGDWVEIYSSGFTSPRSILVDLGVVEEINGDLLNYRSNATGKQKKTQVGWVIVVPSPAEIEAGCAEVQSTWSETRRELSRVTRTERVQIYGC